MELKKSHKADLERNRGIFLQIGLVVVLSVIWIAFEWTSNPDKGDGDKLIADTNFEVEEMQVTRREEQPKPEPEQKQQVTEILNIVEDDVVIDDDFDFDMEADANTEFEFSGFVDEEEFDEEEVFYIVEDMPTFNGGDPAIEFRKYIAQNLRYPDIAAENGISGRVIVQFAVNSVGKIVDAKVVAGVDPALDKEAMRVVMTSPSWTPGKQRGKAVKVLFTFPINFVLQ
ncbi:MAG: energy transducer TonB [Bacteroidales bacterium]|nr:energy transducer TonB [Bacteroidales bacterium]MCF8389054.1 energy transducer TonB [Bacteroidales bacterium]